MSMLGLALLYVGFVLIINGLWILGKLEARSVAPLNFFVGGLIVAGVLRTILTGTEQAQYFGAAQSLLFGFTYLMVALNNCCGLDGRSLGWYCLLVSITAVPSGILALRIWGFLVYGLCGQPCGLLSFSFSLWEWKESAGPQGSGPL